MIASTFSVSIKRAHKTPIVFLIARKEPPAKTLACIIFILEISLKCNVWVVSILVKFVLAPVVSVVPVHTVVMITVAFIQSPGPGRFIGTRVPS